MVYGGRGGEWRRSLCLVDGGCGWRRCWCTMVVVVGGSGIGYDGASDAGGVVVLLIVVDCCDDSGG